MKDYKEILEGVMNIINTTEKSDIGFVNICTYISENCPELKESEDERIRKGLIQYFSTFRLGTFAGLEPKKIIAWLEKQGEKMSNPRYSILAKLIEADDIYQMSVNASMVKEAKNKAIDALSKLEISELLGLEKQGEQILANIAKTCKDEQKPNPYSGTSFDYDGHTWGMCARDNGVELLLDGELKAFLSLEKSFIYPIHSQSELAPKSALEAVNEEKVDNANKVEPKDYNDIDPHFGKPIDKVEPKFKVGDWVCDDTMRIHFRVDEVLSDMYRLTDNTGKIYYKPKAEVEAVCRKFDVLKDAEKKEPKKIEQNPWSEVDNFMYNKIKNLLTDISLAPEAINSLFDWLKDLKDRVQPQTTWKPSEEHIHGLIWVINRMPDIKKANEAEAVLRDLLEQLNKLRKE